MIDDATLDRARGVLIGGAAGDALGAPYEFGPPLGREVEVGMVGGGSFGWAVGEWTDDTAMAAAIAEVAAGSSLLDVASQDRLVTRWAEWARTAKDVGNQTSRVLGRVTGGPGAALQASALAQQLHERTQHTGGNGALMRTGPVALAYLDDEDGLVRAAREIGELTHVDPDSSDACVLWCVAIRHAVCTGELDVRVGLPRLGEDRRAEWVDRLTVAEVNWPSEFEENGWVVQALQAAWSAISTTPVPSRDRRAHLPTALEAAVRGGRDTDTVAAIAGALLGAAYGESAVPAAWRQVLHGWPGTDADGLAALATAIVTR